MNIDRPGLASPVSINPIIYTFSRVITLAQQSILDLGLAAVI
jgi:hypothetical protein